MVWVKQDEGQEAQGKWKLVQEDAFILSAFSLPQFERRDRERWLLMAAVKGGRGERREVMGEDGVIWRELVLYEA